MKRNLIAIIIMLSVMLLAPFKVSAACTTYTNHYLFHATLETASTPNGIYPNLTQDCTSSGEICKWTNRVDSASFIYDIPDDAEITNKGEFINILTSSGVNTYHTAWKRMLENNSYKYSSGTNNYYINNIHDDGDDEIDWEDETEIPYLFNMAKVNPDHNWDTFMRTTNGFVLNANLYKSDIGNGFTYEVNNNVSHTISGNNIKINLNRDFSITYDLLAGSENYNISSYSGSTNYVRIVPSVYIIEYQVGDTCDEEDTGTFTVKYDGNGGTLVSGKKKTFTLDDGDKHTIEDSMFTREGYDFLGWSTNSKATTPNSSYNPGKTVSSTTTLYAVWEKIDGTGYTITYHKNDGTSDVRTSDNSKVIGENPFTREGYKFVGWSTDKDATKADSNYEPGDTYDKKANLDLYAVWVKEGATGTTEQTKTGLGYSIGILSVILAATAGGVVYFKRRNKFENI